VLGDVGDPEPVRAVRGELPLDQVSDRFLSRHAFRAAAQRQTGQPGALHQQPHRVVPDHQAVGALQLSQYPGTAVGGVVDLADKVGQPRVPDRPR
jgi:hypothetical protein